ncbi:MAG: transposase [Candidatus Aminicenantes bacterium]|nr:transposase [Candidatus Aminicenantes bacterium]
MPGVVALIQTFGDRINFYPHIHILRRKWRWG